MAISTNPKPTIYRNLYVNTDPVAPGDRRGELITDEYDNQLFFSFI